MLPRLFLDSYSTQEIVDLFKDKNNCKQCRNKHIYTGKIPFGQGDFHRFFL